MTQGPSRRTYADTVREYPRRHGCARSANGNLEAVREDGVTASTTVCRAPDMLLETSHVHRIESLSAWTACSEPHHSETSVFEICDGCRIVTEHVASRLACDIATLFAASGFAPDRSVIGIHGRYSDCGGTAPNP